MPSVRAAHGSNPRCVAGCFKPVMNRRSDLAALDRGLAGAMVTGNEQHDPVAACDGLLEGTVNRGPRLVEIVAVEVEDAIGFDIARPKPTIPTAVQRNTRRGSGGRDRRSSAHG